MLCFALVVDSCPGVVAELEGRPGVFISGIVKPALQGVKISITTEGGSNEQIITVETNTKGAYE